MTTLQPLDPTKLARALVLWLYLYLAAQVGMALAIAYQIPQYARLDPSMSVSFSESLPGMEISDSISGLAALVMVVTFVVAGFLTLKWIYRVNKNAHVLATGLKSSPGWSVGWYFVPVAFLWKPFKGVEEAWKVSVDPAAWQAVETPSMLRWWWGLWLVDNMVSNVSARLTFRGGTVQMMQISQYLDLLSVALNVPLTLVLVAIVRQLTANQTVALRQQTF